MSPAEWTCKDDDKSLILLLASTLPTEWGPDLTLAKALLELARSISEDDDYLTTVSGEQREQLKHAMADLDNRVAPYNYRELKTLGGVYRRAVAEVVATAKDRYLTRWLALFDGIDGKKEIWRRLTADGRNTDRCGSESSYYRTVNRLGGLQEFLAWYFECHLPDALARLEVVDHEIETAFNHLREFEAEIRKAVYRVRGQDWVPPFQWW